MFIRIQFIDNKYYELAGSYESLKEASSVLQFEQGTIYVVDKLFAKTLIEVYNTNIEEIANAKISGPATNNS